MTPSADSERNRTMNIANKIVANAIKAQTARNSVEVEVSLMYAGRVQHAMRDAVRTVSGVRMASTNTLICPDEDAADEVVDILEQAGVPKREISLNAECVARRTSTNAVTITRDNRKEDYWIHGTVGDFKFEAKMFDEGSVYGIDHGRVSKLWMVRALPNNGREIVSYERGWDVRPKSPEAKAAFSELMGKLKNLPKVDNAVARNERVARNAMQDAGGYVRECNKFIPEANAMIREWDAFYKKMTAKRKWYDSKMTELRNGFYGINKDDPDYDKARAAYDALSDVSRSAESVHLFYSVPWSH